MTRLAVTGHRGMPAATEQLVDEAIRAEVGRYPAGELTGLSCLADGADSIFAQAVLDRNGTLDVIVPAVEYRAGLPREHHPTYDRLLAAALVVERLDHVASTEQSHMDASNAMLDRAERLLAVWDGKPARGYGGTADVIDSAHQRGLPVTVVWPDGATRD